MSELDAVRAEIVASHALPAEALKFVHGGTVDEIEAEAEALVKVLGGGQAPVQRTDLLAVAQAQQAHRKQELLAALTDPGPQPRDEAGRYAARGLFDGGARGTVPAPRDPETEHTALLADLALASRQARGPADVGRHF